MRLPWRDNKHDLPVNYELAKKRLKSLQHSLNKRNPELIQRYNEQLLDQLKQGFMETVEEPSFHTGTVHYIPHFPVFKEDSVTTKMRIVYPLWHEPGKTPVNRGFSSVILPRKPGLFTEKARLPDVHGKARLTEKARLARLTEKAWFARYTRLTGLSRLTGLHRAHLVTGLPR